MPRPAPCTLKPQTVTLNEPTVHDYRQATLKFGHEIRSLKALAPGRYAVDATGPGVAQGDQVRFTLKGSESLELLLTVEEIEYRIIPENAWRATLVGEDFTVLQIHRWSVVCDGCGCKMDFEFAVREGSDSDATTQAATDRIHTLGWRTERDRQLCAQC